MNKTLKSLLTVSLLFSQVSHVYLVQGQGETGQDPEVVTEPEVTNPPVTTPPVTEPEVTDPPETQPTTSGPVSSTEAPSSESTEAPTSSTSTTKETSEETTQAPVTTQEPARPWVPPFIPSPLDPNPIGTGDRGISLTHPENIREEKDDKENQYLSDLMAGSLMNPAFETAFNDYQYAVATYTFDNKTDGSALLEVQTDFERYLTEKTIPEMDTSIESSTEDDGNELQDEAAYTAEVDMTPEIIEFENYQLVNYHYYIKEERENINEPLTTLQFVFEDDKLMAVEIVNNLPIIFKALTEEQIKTLATEDVAPFDFAMYGVPVIGLAHKAEDDGTKEMILVPSGEEEPFNYEFIEVAEDKLNHLDSKKYEENKPAMIQLSEFVTGQDMSTLANEASDNSDESSEESMDESNVEESENITEFEMDNSQTTEKVPDETPSIDNPILTKVPLDFTPDLKKVIGVGKLRDSYNIFLDKTNSGGEVLLQDTLEWFGQPTDQSEAGSSVLNKYLAVAEDKVLLISVMSDKESGKVQEIKVDNRTNRLFEAFPISLNDLYVIANDNSNIISNLSKQLGDPTVVEYLPSSNQRRYVWTSFEDKEMKNIEAIEDLKTKQIELLYYEP